MLARACYDVFHGQRLEGECSCSLLQHLNFVGKFANIATRAALGLTGGMLYLLLAGHVSSCIRMPVKLVRFKTGSRGHCR